VNAALIGVCSFQSAQMVNLVATESLSPVASYEASEVTETEEPPSEWEARKAILDRNLFGARIIDEPAPEPDPEPVVENVEETKLPLILTATIAGSRPGVSRAAIRDTKARETSVLSVGDELEEYSNVTIASIERRRVVLVNNGRYEELLLEEDKPGDPTGTLSRGRSAPAASRASVKKSGSKSARRSRRPSSRGADDPRAARIRQMSNEKRERGEELTLEDITSEIERMRKAGPN
jgi:type II secretory pathway component PulC